MAEQMRQPEPGEERIPEALREDLAALYAPRVPVPGEMDKAMAALARRQLGRQRRPQWLLWTASMAAAAGLLIAAWLAVRPAEYQRTGDIRDAFYLARQMKVGAPVGRQWDANGDGVIDKRDVDALAASAVDLRRGTL